MKVSIDRGRRCFRQRFGDTRDFTPRYSRARHARIDRKNIWASEYLPRFDLRLRSKRRRKVREMRGFELIDEKRGKDDYLTCDAGVAKLLPFLDCRDAICER